MRMHLLLLLPCLILAAENAQAAAVPCAEGQADAHACSRVDLLSHLSAQEIGGGSVSDIWGWTDLADGKEYAIVGRFLGTSFVDISDPENPVYLGNLPDHTEIIGVHGKTGQSGGRSAAHPLHEEEGSIWRDIKVYENYAVIVSDHAGHGMQIFDLTQLRTVDRSNLPVTFNETAHYGGFGNSHNVFVNEASGFAYAVGSNTFGGGPHFVDLNDPENPASAGGYADDGYSHDIQCVIYTGPDTRYADQEICFASNEDTLTVLDVTDKNAVLQLSRTGYPQSAYAHQGWLSEDQRWFFVNDELDEINFGLRTRTLVWDVSDLAAPRLAAEYLAPTVATDHNNYVRGRYLYQSHYKAGLRILDIGAPANPYEMGFFDTYPAADDDGFEGTWSNYPYFASGVVAVSDISGGLFLLRPTFTAGMTNNADLAVVVRNANLQAVRDQTHKWLLTVTNNGPDVAPDVVVTLALPDWAGIQGSDADPGVCLRSGQVLRCRLGELAAGELLELTVDAVAHAVGELRADAMVSAFAEDPSSGNNTDSATAAVNDGGGGTAGACLIAGLLLLTGLGMQRERKRK